MFDRILMVCIGNICRSPMAEVLLADRLARKGHRVRVESAGLGALVGHPADPTSQALMEARGLSLAEHRARQVTPELVADFDLVLVMEEGQRRHLEQTVPQSRGRVHAIGKFGGFDVPDPYRQPSEAFEEALRLIERGLDDFERAFWNQGAPAVGTSKEEKGS